MNKMYAYELSDLTDAELSLLIIGIDPKDYPELREAD